MLQALSTRKYNCVWDKKSKLYKNKKGKNKRKALERPRKTADQEASEEIKKNIQQQYNRCIVTREK